jgi:hypothetical protein
MVVVGKFYKVVSDSLGKFGLYKGSYVLCAGEGMYPETPDDPYLFRKFFAVLLVDDNGSTDLESPAHVVNANSLEETSEEVQQNLLKVLATQVEPVEIS